MLKELQLAIVDADKESKRLVIYDSSNIEKSSIVSAVLPIIHEDLNIISNQILKKIFANIDTDIIEINGVVSTASPSLNEESNIIKGQNSQKENQSGIIDSKSNEWKVNKRKVN